MKPTPGPYPFTREIQRLSRLMLVLFGIVAMSAAYWAIVGPDTLLLGRPDNPRRLAAEARVQRGMIIDRESVALAETQASDNNLVRRYPVSAAWSALGYASGIHGNGGVEALFNPLLRGETLDLAVGDEILNSLLRIPPRGLDLQLTLSTEVQMDAHEALMGYQGAIVIMHVPSGQLLALVSLPDFDPESIDQQWENLRTHPDEPLVNRTLDRAYPLGGLVETPLLAAALLLGFPIDQPLAGAADPVTVNDMSYPCAVPLPALDLTLSEAYSFACPAAFTVLAAELGSTAVTTSFETFQLTQPVGLYPMEPQDALSLSLDDQSLLAEALGQGSITITPLTAAVMTAAMINDGNAPQPFILQAYREPASETWTSAAPIVPLLPMATVDTARRISDLMRANVAAGAAQNAGRPETDIGGHAALAWNSDQPLSWFIGFITLGGSQSVAAAVILENIDDVGLAADIGGTVLESARRYLLNAASAATP